MKIAVTEHSGRDSATWREFSADPPLDPALAPLLGQVIAGRYKIVELLAAGGMGAVYLAEHVHLRNHVAVKVLHPDTENYDEMAARFEREAIAGAHIRHPNVVSATDFDRLEDGTCFLVLEYVRGVTLHQLLRQGPLPAARAVHIARQIAAALGAAHDMGILHRDVKPRNVMLVEPDPRAAEGASAARRDHVKLIDFGLCKLPLDRISTTGAVTRSQAALTAKGVVFGTPPFMAPETALGMDSVDLRADLYALGIVLYRMLAGKHPFDASTESEHILANRLAPAPPIRLRSPGAVVPRELEAVVMRLLKKDLRARYSDAASLIAALDAAVPEAAVERDWVPWNAPLPISVAGADWGPDDEPDTSGDLEDTRARTGPVQPEPPGTTESSEPPAAPLTVASAPKPRTRAALVVAMVVAVLAILAYAALTLGRAWTRPLSGSTVHLEPEKMAP